MLYSGSVSVYGMLFQIRVPRTPRCCVVILVEDWNPVCVNMLLTTGSLDTPLYLAFFFLFCLVSCMYTLRSYTARQGYGVEISLDVQMSRCLGHAVHVKLVFYLTAGRLRRYQIVPFCIPYYTFLLLLANMVSILERMVLTSRKFRFGGFCGKKQSASIFYSRV